MAFRMSEQPRTIKIYICWPELMNLLVKVTHIFRLIRSASKQYRYCTARYSGWLCAVFNSDEASWHLVEDHRGKTSMTWLPATRYLFLNLARYRKCHLVIPGRGISEVERHSLGEDTEAEKLFRIREAEETKNS